MNWLADALRAAGLEVWELDGWRTWEPGYAWRETPGGLYEPEGHIVHHTATDGYTPNVHNSSGQTKANAYVGLRREGRLYFSGGGVPTVALCASRPANDSAGYGCRYVLEDYVRLDKRYSGPQSNPDDSPSWAGNRSYWNTETIHPGYGEPLDAGVWDLLIGYSAVLCMELGWAPWRTIAHEDHTKRKVDPRFEQGTPYTIAQIQDDVELWMEGKTVDLQRWASRLRREDINQYVKIGVLTSTESSYWIGMLGDWQNPEWQDLRDAAMVRGPIYGYPGQQ